MSALDFDHQCFADRIDDAPATQRRPRQRSVAIFHDMVCNPLLIALALCIGVMVIAALLIGLTHIGKLTDPSPCRRLQRL